MEARSSSAPSLRASLPWITALSALVLYLLTLSHWVTLSSAPVVAKMVGWDRFPTISGPLLFLLSWPISHAPIGMQPLLLNALAAVLGAFSVGLLTRSVLLVPHDRTKEQRTRERGPLSLLSVTLWWLPPVLAGGALMFQLSYWENATSQTGEMLDLLFFSASIYFLLDYRLCRRNAQLYKLSLVYALGITNNWALIAFFPLFFLSIVWVKGRSFFSFGFLGKMLGCGLLGLLPYLVLPLVASLDTTLGSTFSDLLRQELGSQKSALLQFPRSRILIMSLTSIVPVIFMGIKWPSSFGDTSLAGTSATNLMFRLLHALFLGACCWVMFDPKFSPRYLGNGFALLPLYYLTALAMGYFAGYFLLAFSPPKGKSQHRGSPTNPFGPLMQGVILIAGVAIPLTLLLLNFNDIRAKNGPALRLYVEGLRDSLPTESALVLSDNRYDPLLLEGLQTEAGKKGHHRLIETKLLEWRFYHRNLARAYPNRLPPLSDLERLPEPIDSLLQVQYLYSLGKSNAVYYLHPSFGYFFEAGFLKPKGALFEMVFYSETNFSAPSLQAPEVAELEKHWKARLANLATIAEGVKMKIPDLALLGTWYSRTLNSLGVELQKVNRVGEAGAWFDLAVKLNPQNVAAIINKQFNQSLGKEKSKTLDFGAEVKELVKQYASWGDLLVVNGPIDEPSFCFELGTQFSQGGNYHQAAAEFLRVLAWEPQNLLNQISLARAYHYGSAPENALQTIEAIGKNPASSNLKQEQFVELSRISALAKYSLKDFAGAETTLMASQAKYPRDPTVLNSLFDLYYHHGDTAKALSTVEILLKTAPDNIEALLKQVGLLMQERSFEKAIAALDQILKIQPNHELALLNQGAIHIHNKRFAEALKPLEKVLDGNPNHFAARLNRAIVFLQTGKWQEASKDYLALAKVSPNSHVVVYGLAESAFHLDDKKQAHEYFQKYLKIAPPGTLEIQTATTRLNSLK